MMMTNNPTESSYKRLTAVTLAASIAVFLLIVAGGVVRVTNAGAACPDWPTCLGSFAPPQAESALLSYIHRALAALSVALVGIAAVLAWKNFRPQSWISRPIVLATLLIVVQVFLSGAASLAGSWAPFEGSGPSWISTLHLGLSLVIQAALLVGLVAAYYSWRTGPGESALQLRFRTKFAHMSLVTFFLLFALLVSGALVSGAGTTAACASWPLCTAELAAGESAAWLNLLHRVIVAATGILMAALLVKAWRTQRNATPILVATTTAVVLFYSQALLGARLVEGFPAYLLGLHTATAVAVWAALTIQVVFVGLAGRSAEDEAVDLAVVKAGRKGLVKDLLMLTKPIVVLLLLVTTYTGMVIGGQAWPSLSLTFWTLLGGFMAAGGSGAINQYIDRYDDRKMQRTQKRPIPSGRLTPAEGLAFGVGLALASVYLMTAMVNFLAAMLSLAGIIYYVLLYSIILKKTTVQNIVIGGGAGAIPPLVGWAAATGSLNVPSLFLFAIVFMWTPPHFWALALVRRKDYARAGVPMLPVIRGEKETRWQIFLYTISLVVLTLLLPLFGLGGSIYFIGALMLGSWLLFSAWKVWKKGGNKLAWKMYRYSSMYLAFIFIVLMVDALL